MSEVLDGCGVYEITNTINGKRYIGSSITMNLRWRAHKKLLRNNKHSNIILQRAVNKYGLNNFSCRVIERCTESVVREREQVYLILTKPEYNMTLFVVNPIRFTFEVRAKMSAAKIGKKQTTAHRASLSESLRGTVKRGDAPNGMSWASWLREQLKNHSYEEVCTKYVTLRGKNLKSARDHIRLALKWQT
jgi:group I intron endonuclease